MTSSNPGRASRLLTTALDAMFPATGTRRINMRQENEALHVRNSELTSECRYLRRELSRVQGENNLFREQDDFNAAIHEPQFMSANLPFGNDAESTMAFSVPNGPAVKAKLTTWPILKAATESLRSHP